MPRESSTTSRTSAGRAYMVQPSDIPVIVIRKALPGLLVRLLADRDAGVVVWESYFLDDSGAVIADGPQITLGLEHLINLDGIFEALREARDELTPRRRLDLARLNPPVDLMPNTED